MVYTPLNTFPPAPLCRTNTPSPPPPPPHGLLYSPSLEVCFVLICLSHAFMGDNLSFFSCGSCVLQFITCITFSSHLTRPYIFLLMHTIYYYTLTFEPHLFPGGHNIWYWIMIFTISFYLRCDFLACCAHSQWNGVRINGNVPLACAWSQ